jgi:hypothetical protein
MTTYQAALAGSRRFGWLASTSIAAGGTGVTPTRNRGGEARSSSARKRRVVPSRSTPVSSTGARGSLTSRTCAPAGAPVTSTLAGPAAPSGTTSAPASPVRSSRRT